MPEPKRTNVSRTEGEDSVSSVSLELIYGVMEAKESRLQICISASEHIKVLEPCSKSSIWVLSSIMGPISKGGPSFQSLESPPFFMDLDWSQKSRPYEPMWPQTSSLAPW
ncbi:hypothetical protein O181_038769 [Austropuccinia psidii MF-1]|uniref:Uncharacterized protein n=1 Tax=Austropuccinia psidii MF-1 TaxID=1389203 RepID=A0A9Q3D901_9BASI|nr:hypothetical protein [Austropuccinia psidii MF-1]